MEDTIETLDIDAIERKAIDIINMEMIKFTKEDQEIVATFCLQTCLYRKLHTLFTETELLGITDQVFTNVTIRDFVLDLTDKLSVKLGMDSRKELEMYLARTIGSFGNRSNVVNALILTPVRVMDNISVYVDEIQEVLFNNKWLVSIVLINLYFFNSDFFSQEKIDQTQSPIK